MGKLKLKNAPTVEVLTEEHKEAEKCAKELYKAMDGVGTNEKEIIRIVLGNSNHQLQLIKNQYLLLYKQYLERSLEQNISGNFGEIISALLKNRNEFQAGYMNQAISEIGDDEDAIIEILCTKSSEELDDLKEGYLKKYNRDLESDIKNVSDGDFNDLYLSLASGKRKANHGYDLNESKELAQKLVNSSKGNKIDEKAFIEILSTTSFAQLNSVIAIFEDLTNQKIIDVVTPRSEGNMKKLFSTMIKCVRERPRYFAEQIHYALSGIGTRDKMLIYYIVSRYEIDMKEIKNEYKKLYKETLYKDVKNDTGGYYEDVLLSLIGSD